MLPARSPVALFGNGWGDHLLALPAIRALESLFPGQLTLVCVPGAHQTFFADLPLHRVYEVPMTGTGEGRRFDAEAVAGHVGATDLLVSFNPWHSPDVDCLIAVLSPPESVGFHPSFSVHLPFDTSKHSAELAFDVPRYLDDNLRLNDFAHPPVFPERARHAARELRALIPAPMRAMVIHADTGLWRKGAGEPLQTKMWPVERFVQMMDAFLERHPDFVAFVVGSEPLGLDRGRCGNRVISCVGLALDTSLALVGEADVFVGIDSCMLHAADFFRVPGVGLFGPSDSREFGFLFAPHRHVKGDWSMASISVAAVLDAVESLLVETASRTFANAGHAG